jgi:outer membrane lipoprotein-sorting protein
MNVAKRTVALLAVLTLGVAGTGRPLAAQTVDEILDQHFAAVGGKEKIAAVQSARLSGKQQFGPQEAPFSIQWKRPNKIRIEFTLQGLTGIQAYDGAGAWQVMPFLGKNDPEAVTGDDLKGMEEQADLIEGPMFNWKEKGNTVELIGKEPIEGTDAWKLKVTKKNGDLTYVWLDAESMLQIKSEGKRKRGDQELEFESSLGDYKEVDGLLFPHSIEQRPKGAPQGATITVEKVELGVAIDDAIFVMPPKPEAKPEEKPAGN